MKTKTKAYLAWVAICIIWGTTYLAIKIGVSEIPPFLFAGFRWFFVGAIFLFFLKIRGVPLPAKKDLLPLATAGILLIGISNGLVSYAEQWVPSGLTALLLTTVTILVVLIETVILKKVVFNKLIMIGVIIGFGGILLILGNNLELLFEREYLFGVLAICIGIISWASGTVYSKHRKIDVHPFAKAAVQMIFAGAFQLIIGTLIGEFEHFTITKTGLIAFVYLSIFGSFIAYVSFVYAVEHLPISFVITYSYINPVIALFAGWFILDEIISFEIILAAIIILVGVALINRGNKKRSNA